MIEAHEAEDGDRDEHTPSEGQPTTARLTGAVSEAMRQWRRYRLALRWIVSDAAGRYRIRMVGVVGAGVAGAAAQGVAFGLALAYANGLEADRTFDLRVVVATPREDLWLLYAVGAGVTMCLLTAVALLYYFQRGAVRLGKDYEELCVRRTVSLASHLPHPHASTANEQLERKHLERVLNDARLCGRVLRLLTRSVLPFIVTPATVIIMFVLNPLLSVIIALLALLGGASLYRVNVKGARASNKMEQLGREATHQRRDAVQRALHSAAPLSDQDPDLKRLTSEGPARRRLDAYADRLEAVEESGLVTGALAAVALGAILTIQGRSILQGTGSVSLLVAYVAVLRLFVTNFMKLGRTVSGVSRFYPQIRRHFEFTDDASSATRESPSSPAFPVTVNTDDLQHGQQDQVCTQLVAGSRIGVITTAPANRALLAKLSASISASSDASVRIRLAAAAASTGQTLAAAFGFPATVKDPRDSLTMGESTARFVEHALHETGGLRVIQPRAINELDEQHRFVLSFLAGVLARPHILVVPNQQWGGVPAHVRDELDGLAADVVLAYAGTSENEHFPLDAGAHMMVVTDTGLVGRTSHGWIRDNRKVVKSLLRSSPVREETTPHSATEDDEEEVE